MSRDALVSGIVVNFRTPELSARAVRSLVADGVDEVVVVDNSADDPASGSLRALDGPVRYVASDANVGFGQGVNAGAELAAGEFLLLLNSDAEIETGSTARLLEQLDRRPDAAIAAPTILLTDGTSQPDAHGVFPSIGTTLLRTNRHPPDAGEPDWVSGVGLLVRASAFRDVGGFDPRFFMYFEDIDLCRRLRAAGHTIVRQSDAVVRHHRGASRTSSRSSHDQYLAAQDEYVRAAAWPWWRVVVLRVIRVPTVVAHRLCAASDG